MDEMNRGTSNYLNGNLQIDLNDDYEHIDNNIEYVIENVLQTTNRKSPDYFAMQEKFNTFAAQPCECIKDSEQNRCINEECLHGGNYSIYEDVQTQRRQLVLNKSRKSRDIIYECSEFCSCPPHCYNRLVQYGPRTNLKIVDYSHLGKQFGLSTLIPIPKGSFICEYAGEILTQEEARNRHQMNDANKKMNYIICLNERPIVDRTNAESQDSQCKIQTFIDPSRIGNIGRYLNHSCDPNCEIISVRIDGIIPKLGIFSKVDIQPNTELCFDYGEDENNLGTSAQTAERISCHCGTEKCRRFLPNL